MYLHSEDWVFTWFLTMCLHSRVARRFHSAKLCVYMAKLGVYKVRTICLHGVVKCLYSQESVIFIEQTDFRVFRPKI